VGSDTGEPTFEAVLARWQAAIAAARGRAAGSRRVARSGDAQVKASADRVDRSWERIAKVQAVISPRP
jgi:hypothetical protein